MSHPSTITARRDIQQNGKWHNNVNVKCWIVDVSLNILASSGRKRIKLPPFVAARRDGSNELRYILLRSLDAEIFNETANGAVTKMLNAELLMFRWISRHPVVVEGWDYHHSTRLDEAVLMSCVKSFYDHWMLRYLTKRIFLIFNFEIWTRTVKSDQFWLDWIWTDLIWIWQIRSDQIQSDQFFLGALLLRLVTIIFI